MKTTVLWTALLCVVLAACSGDTTSEDSTPDDAALSDTGGADVAQDSAADTSPGDSARADAPIEGDVADDTRPDLPDDVGGDVSEEDVAPDTAIAPDTAVDVEADVAQEDVTEDTAAEDVGEDVGESFPRPGFGAIAGDCDVLDMELEAQSSFLFQNSIDFGDDPYDEGDLMLLTEGGQEVLSDGNAGGSSLLSEVFAYEMLARCEGASLLATENEISYDDPNSKLTDMLVSIDGLRIGVSVTRAVGFPRDDPYTVERAQGLLEDKLADVLDSSANVSEQDAWVKQILHVIAYAPQHAASIAEAHALVDPAVRSDTIVIVTVSEGEDAFLY